MQVKQLNRWMDGWINPVFNSDSYLMLGSVISSGHIQLNTAGFRQVCAGSKDGESTGFKPEKAKACLAWGDDACERTDAERASVTSTLHWVRSINIKP